MLFCQNVLCHRHLKRIVPNNTENWIHWVTVLLMNCSTFKSAESPEFMEKLGDMILANK